MVEQGKLVYRAELTFIDHLDRACYVKSLEYRTERGLRNWIARQEAKWDERPYREVIEVYEAVDVRVRYARAGRPRKDV